MNASEIIQQIENRRGQHVKVTWQRVAKTLKAASLVVSKRTSAWVRSGIDFSNLRVVKEGIENGERGEVQPLPWGEWIDFPFIIGHKGMEYVRLYPASFDNLVPEVEWSINDRPSTYEKVEPYLLSSEKRKDEDDKPLCFTVKSESVISIED
jgi:hypothetical protein